MSSPIKSEVSKLSSSQISISSKSLSLPDLKDKEISSKLIAEYLHSFSPLSEVSSSCSSSSSMVVSRMKEFGRERRKEIGVDPSFIGEFGGIVLQKYSGERMGPKLTFFLNLLSLWWVSESPNDSLDKDVSSCRLLFLSLGHEPVKDSSTSLMETNDDFWELREARKDFSRDGMGVRTLGFLELTDFEVAPSSYLNKQ